jgi:hypothetical protein
LRATPPRDPARTPAISAQIHTRPGIRSPYSDGIGDIHAIGAIGAGLIESCAGCHGRPRGAAGFGGDVVTRPDSRDAPHLFGLGLQEMLADEITSELRAIRAQAVAQAASQGRPISRNLVGQGNLVRIDSCKPRWIRQYDGSARRQC